MAQIALVRYYISGKLFNLRTSFSELLSITKAWLEELQLRKDLRLGSKSATAFQASSGRAGRRRSHAQFPYRKSTKAGRQFGFESVPPSSYGSAQLVVPSYSCGYS
jgi:hypothetical protein